MSLPFPTSGYVTSVVPLDNWIQITTEVATKTKRHCAVILIGNTNYRLKAGDIVWWNEGRSSPSRQRCGSRKGPEGRQG
jgi:uncharacterized protein involved in tellurium resistance